MYVFLEEPNIDVTRQRSGELAAVSRRRGSDPTGGDPVSGALGHTQPAAVVAGISGKVVAAAVVA